MLQPLQRSFDHVVRLHPEELGNLGAIHPHGLMIIRFLFVRLVAWSGQAECSQEPEGNGTQGDETAFVHIPLLSSTLRSQLNRPARSRSQARNSQNTCAPIAAPQRNQLNELVTIRHHDEGPRLPVAR